MFGKNDKNKPAKNGVAVAPPQPVAAHMQSRAPESAQRTNGEAAQTKAELSEEAKTALRQSHQAHLATGQIVTVLMNAPECQKFTLDNIKGLVAPAVASGQFVLAMGQAKESGHVFPAGVALWASVSDEVDARLSKVEDNFTISASEWRSGPNAWLIMMAGDQRVLNPMLTKLQASTLRGRPLKMRAAGKDGKVGVHAFSPTAAAPAAASVLSEKLN